jgi:hypothetical protein
MRSHIRQEHRLFDDLHELKVGLAGRRYSSSPSPSESEQPSPTPAPTRPFSSSSDASS